MQVTRIGGHIPIVGFLARQTAAVNLLQLIFRQTTIQGNAAGQRRVFEKMNLALGKGGVRPAIDEVYLSDQAVAAYEQPAKGAFGKIVMNVQQARRKHSSD